MYDIILIPSSKSKNMKINENKIEMRKETKIN